MYKEGIVFMDYRTILQEENDAVRERLDLSMERVTAMEEEDIRQPYGNYFRCVSRFILMIGELVKERQEGRKLFLTQLQERNHRLYEDILPEHYEESFANPDYAVKELGEGYGQILSALYTEIRGDIVYAFEMRLENIAILNEVFLEVYNLFVQAWEEGADCPKEQQIKEPIECRQLLIDSIKEQMDVGETAYEFENQTSVVLVIGVNGVGKTTTIGKLAGKMRGQGKKVVLAAADTFRAAAGDQLKEWAHRSDADLIGGQEGADPAAIVYDAVAAAKARKADILLVDTAGRLHNKKNLMEELKKINRVLEREYPEAYRETLVVLDATTGQNALSQAKEFSDVADITGIILTKMDGTAKGGIAVAIQAELGIPVKYIGVGETIDDLQKFDSDEFVQALFTTEKKKEEGEE